jgi:signal transduction histidine kinase
MNVFLERDHARRVDELATRKGVSRSGIVAAALASFLSPEDGRQQEAALARRLDRLTRQYERLERDQTILIETMALFIRHSLAVAAPIPETQLDAVRAQGRLRFAQFVEQLGRHLQDGGRLVRDLVEEAVVQEGDLFGVPEVTDTMEDASCPTQT